MKKFLDGLIKQNDIIINNSNEYKNYIRQAYKYGNNNSNNDITWTGAVIVDKEGKILSYGTNKIKGLDNPDIKLKKEDNGYENLWHAERNAIFNAGGISLENEQGINLKGSTMYMPWVPCTPCANAIIKSNISTLVMHEPKILKTPNHRIDNVKDAVFLLLKKNVELVFVTDEIGGCKSRINGEDWNP